MMNRESESLNEKPIDQYTEEDKAVLAMVEKEKIPYPDQPRDR